MASAPPAGQLPAQWYQPLAGTVAWRHTLGGPPLVLPALPSPARARDASRELTVTETLDECQGVAVPMLSDQTHPHLHT